MVDCKPLTREDWQNLLQKIDTFLFDADGVLWHGNYPIPGSVEAIKKLFSLGKKVCLVTNNSTRSRAAYAEKCQKLGFDSFTKDIIVTTSAVLANHLASIELQGKVYVVGSSGIAAELDNVGVPYLGIGPDHFDSYNLDPLVQVPLDPEVRAVAVGFDPHLSYPKLMKAASYLKNPQCLFIATNEDETLPSNDPKYTLPGSGSVLASVITATQRKPLILGKPHRPIFEYVQSLFVDQVDPSRTLMIGDRCNTDVKFARDNGLHSLLVFTGDATLSDIQKYQEEKKLDLVPHFYTDRLGDILGL